MFSISLGVRVAAVWKREFEEVYYQGTIAAFDYKRKRPICINFDDGASLWCTVDDIRWISQNVRTWRPKNAPLTSESSTKKKKGGKEKDVEVKEKGEDRREEGKEEVSKKRKREIVGDFERGRSPKSKIESSPSLPPSSSPPSLTFLKSSSLISLPPLAALSSYFTSSSLAKSLGLGETQFFSPFTDFRWVFGTQIHSRQPIDQP